MPEPHGLTFSSDRFSDLVAGEGATVPPPLPIASYSGGHQQSTVDFSTLLAAEPAQVGWVPASSGGAMSPPGDFSNFSNHLPTASQSAQSRRLGFQVVTARRRDIRIRRPVRQSRRTTNARRARAPARRRSSKPSDLVPRFAPRQGRRRGDFRARVVPALASGLGHDTPRQRRGA